MYLLVANRAICLRHAIPSSASDLSRYFRIDISQNLHKANRVRRIEHTFNPVAMKVGEWSFVEQLRVHDAPRSQMINNLINKLQLIRREPAVLQELSEGALSCFSVEAHEGANEVW